MPTHPVQERAVQARPGQLSVLPTLGVSGPGRSNIGRRHCRYTPLRARLFVLRAKVAVDACLRFFPCRLRRSWTPGCGPADQERWACGGWISPSCSRDGVCVVRCGVVWLWGFAWGFADDRLRVPFPVWARLGRRRSKVYGEERSGAMSDAPRNERDARGWR